MISGFIVHIGLLDSGGEGRWNMWEHSAALHLQTPVENFIFVCVDAKMSF